MKKRVTYLGVLLAFALILSYVESLIPFYFGIPGVKLGLANLAIVLVLYMYGIKDAFLLNLMRVLLAGFMFGNMFMILYSLAGAVCSMGSMYLFKKTDRFSILGVSMSGGIFHNIGQVAVAVFVTQTAGVVYYLPVLLISGVVTGWCIGILAGRMLRYTNGMVKKGRMRE